VILAGDIGGTKTVLAICDDRGVISRDAVFACDQFASLEAILREFLRGETLQAACFGVAGPVVGGVAKITNLPWTIDAAKLTTELGGVPVALLNDLQATALGTLVLPPQAFAVLQAGRASVEPHGSIAVIAPGTGLGEAMLVWDGTRYVAQPSEGGHADFAPTDDEQIELLRFLRSRHGKHVSFERVLSGDGIGDLYDFARQQLRSPEPSWLAAELASGADRNAVVSKAGLAKTDDACVRALDLFARVLGAEAGNLALRGLTTGGVLIGGGIPPKILPALQTGALVERFNNKGRFSTWTAGLAVRVTLEPRAALFGAAQYAVSHVPAAR